MTKKINEHLIKINLKKFLLADSLAIPIKISSLSFMPQLMNFNETFSIIRKNYLTNLHRQCSKRLICERFFLLNNFRQI